jgi:hypothetical protein
MLKAVAFPILPGKTAAWRSWMDELDGPRHGEFVASRQRAGVHERTFLQSTPMGDLVIVTLEGDDPERSFGEMMSSEDAFTTWFLEKAKEIHGLDPSAVAAGSPSRLVVETDRVAVTVA